MEWVRGSGAFLPSFEGERPEIKSRIKCETKEGVQIRLISPCGEQPSILASIRGGMKGSSTGACWNQPDVASASATHLLRVERLFIF